MQIKVPAIANVHCHLRQTIELMRALIVLAIAGGVDVILAMPNTLPGLKTAKQVLEYLKECISLVPADKPVTFIPTAMVTEQTTVADIIECVENGVVDFKLYPKFRTTHSEDGIICYFRVIAVIQEAAKIVMENKGIRIKIHVHPEHPSMEFYSRDAEFTFLPIAYMIVEETEAILIWEHGTDARCIPHWKKLAESGRFFVTLTAHHIATDEDKTFGDVRATCKPPIKTDNDRVSLVRLIKENHCWVMLGPDDAPHPDVPPEPGKPAKHVHEGQCACGAYTSPFLMLLCAHVLDDLVSTSEGLEVFINFTSRNARKLHALPEPIRTFTLVREPFKIPAFYQAGPWKVEPFWAGKTLSWSFAE